MVCDALVNAPDVPVHDGTLEPGVSGQCVAHSKCSFFLFSVIIPKFVEQSLRFTNRTDQVWIIMLIYYIRAHKNKVVPQICNIKTSHYDICFHVFMDFGYIRLAVMGRHMII